MKKNKERIKKIDTTKPPEVQPVGLERITGESQMTEATNAATTTEAPKDDTGSKLVGTHLGKAQRDLLEIAVQLSQPKDASGKATGENLSKAAWLRKAIGMAVAAATGEDWPADEPVQGPQDAIAEAAAKQGMTRAQFVKFASLYAAGVPEAEARAKATAVHPLSKEGKAAKAAAEAAKAATPAS